MQIRADFLTLLQDSTTTPEKLSAFIATVEDKASLASSLTNQGETALHVVIAHGCTNLISVLLQILNMDINAQNKNKQTLLHLICRYGNSDSIKKYVPLLLEKGADPRVTDKSNKTALYYLMTREKITAPLGELLVKYGAGINTQAKNGKTLLHFVASTNLLTPEAVEKYISIFLKYGANPRILNNAGENALQNLIDHDYATPQAGYLLIENGVPVNTRGRYQQTFLHWLAFYKGPDVKETILAYIIKLLALGANPTLLDMRKRNVLCCLMDTGNISNQIALALFECKLSPDIHTQDSKYGETFLHKLTLPANTSLTPFISTYLAKGAKPTVHNNAKEDAFDYFMSRETFSHYELDRALLLVQHGANPNKKTKEGKTLLQIIYELCPTIKDYMVERGINRNQLENPTVVFNTINIASLRFEIRNLSPLHLAVNDVLNLLFLLAIEANTRTPTSCLYALPPEILLHIIGFMLPNKSTSECAALLNFVSAHRETISEMNQTPGGINVMQKKNTDGNFEFTLFKSVKTLCIDFDKLKKKLNTKSEPQMAHRLNNFRQRYAVTTWQAHSSLYKNPASKVELLYCINKAELYNDKSILPKLK